MYKIISCIAVVTLLAGCHSSKSIWEQAEEVLNADKPLTQQEAGEGVKEALVKGITTGVQNVSQVDGYFSNLAIKILLPPDAKKVESTLRDMGLNKLVDNAILSLNRAAEDAAQEALPIFKDAIMSLTFQDAIGIVKGNPDAATRYLEAKTFDRLAAAFQPKIETSLRKVNATKYWADVFNTYNKIPFVKKVNPDLASYVTGLAINGLFFMIEKEEKEIRENPVARTTELLKRIFGKKW